MINTSHPIYRKLWIRIAIPSLCIAWALFELIIGSKGWSIFFAVIGIYSGYIFLVKYESDKKNK